MTAVVAGPVLLATPAGAASSTPGVSGGRTASTVVDLALAGRAELALLQAQGFSQAQRTGAASSTITPQSATAFAGVVGGDPGKQTPAQLQALNGAYASLDKPGPASTTAQAVPGNPLLKLSGGRFTAAVVKKTGSSTSSGDVISFGTASLGSITGLKPITVPLETGLKQVLTAALPATMTVGDVLNQIADQSGALPGPLSATLGATATAAAELLNQLQNLDTLLFKTSLISIEDVTQTQSIEQQTDGVLTTSATQVGTIKVLGGLLKLAGPKTTASAFATGRAGTAKASATTVDTADLSALKGNLLDLIIGSGDQPVDLSVGNASLLPPQLQTALTTLQNQLDAGLGQAGLVAGVGKTSRTVAPDGRTARAAASGLLISLTPPSGSTSTNVLRLALGDSQVVSSMSLATTTAVAAPVTASRTLPRTGADGTALGGVALAALVGAGLLRRRSRA